MDPKDLPKLHVTARTIDQIKSGRLKLKMVDDSGRIDKFRADVTESQWEAIKAILKEAP